MTAPQYCPRCGAPLEQRFTEGRDRDVCPACGFIFYRNPVPAVGVVVELEGGVVLVRRKYAPRAGCWGLPAGYMELGESAEEAAIRECFEETGLLVQIDHLLGVYSFGEQDESGLVIIYAATAVGGALQASDDATDAGAFAIGALPSPFAFRTHMQAIERWRGERRLVQAAPPPAPSGSPEIALNYATQLIAAEALALLLGADSAGDERWLVADALFHDRLHSPDHPIIVAELRGRLAGAALLSIHQTLGGWYATLDDLVVAPAARRQGVGRALVGAARATAVARGCAALHVTSPHAQEAGAGAFLSSCGFGTGAAWTLALGPAAGAG